MGAVYGDTKYELAVSKLFAVITNNLKTALF
jgi:hypothetical protein